MATASTLVESDLFMDALSASAYIKKDTKKRKRRTSASTLTKEGSSPPDSPNNDKVVAPLKFYQDTLDDEDKSTTSTTTSSSSSSSSSSPAPKTTSTENDSEQKETENDNEKMDEDDDDLPLQHVKDAIEQKVREEETESHNNKVDEESYEPPAKKPPGPGCGPNGPPGVLMLHRRKGPKKKVCWKAQEELEEIRFFELDENERVNVTKTFVDMKHMERMNEREAFLMARKLNNDDIMIEQTPWMPLILVDDVPPHPEGNQSKEKRIQAEREQTTLKALYFNRHMIPDSPAEPDMEHYQATEPAIIPLDDITGNPDAVNDFTNMPWPEPKGSLSTVGNENNFTGGRDMPFSPNQFSPFMNFGPQRWQGPGGPQGPVPPHTNGPMHPGMMPPQGIFNNMNMNMPPNLMMGPNSDDMSPPVGMGMIPSQFGPPGVSSSGPPPGFLAGSNMGPGGPPGFLAGPNMNMNPGAFSPPNNANRGPRGPVGGGNRGNWRSGAPGPLNQNGGNWRSQGPNTGSGPNNNWILGNRGRICKQFQRGHCRNGNKCNFFHPPNGHRI